MISKLRRHLMRLKTALSLGIGNVLTVLIYRLALRLSLHPVCLLSASIRGTDFFSGAKDFLPDSATLADLAPRKLKYFGFHEVEFSKFIGDWRTNALTGKMVVGGDLPWWKTSEFDQSIGDIKCIWEPSRMNWLLRMAQDGARGSNRSVQAMNALVHDWVTHNPCYLGPNWKCGQEASIRVMNALVALEILGIWNLPSEAMSDFLEAHLNRIRLTRSYAIAQDNNHGTSEAAALYLGGKYLLEQERVRGVRIPSASKNARIGWSMLIERLQRLILNDGTFSQYSSNYHRMVLDTVSTVEYFRRAKLWAESDSTYFIQVRKAIEWLDSLVDPLTGCVPNFGPNDGSQLLLVHDCDYEDYRPSIMLARTLFFEGASEPVSQAIAFLRGERSICTPAPRREMNSLKKFAEGGVVVATQGEVKCLFRAPIFVFRPSQSDALHLDLWRGSTCLLGDAGTYSYNISPEEHEYFSGPRGHNTIEFDDRAQMPRISRFLFGAWLKSEGLSVEKLADEIRISDGYSDFFGASHSRAIHFTSKQIAVKDAVGGMFRKAVLRWRLPGADYVINGTSLSMSGLKLEVQASAPIKRFEVVTGWASQYYFEKNSIACLEVEFDQPCDVETRITTQ